MCAELENKYNLYTYNKAITIGDDEVKRAFIDKAKQVLSQRKLEINRITRILTISAYNRYIGMRKLKARSDSDSFFIGDNSFDFKDYISQNSPNKFVRTYSQSMEQGINKTLSEISKNIDYRLTKIEKPEIEIPTMMKEYKTGLMNEVKTGLGQWDEAEKKLFMQYKMWQYKNNENYNNVKKQWDEAFRDFDEKKKSWLSVITNEIAQVQTKWQEVIDAAVTNANELNKQMGQTIQMQMENISGYIYALGEDYNYTKNIDLDWVRSVRSGYAKLLTDITGSKDVSEQQLYDMTQPINYV